MLNVIRASDIADTIWERALEDRRQAEAWPADPGFFTLPSNPTWSDIAVHEPRLHDLVQFATDCGIRDRRTYDTWYREVKPQFMALVGTTARDQPPPLRTSQVYDVVYTYLRRRYEGEDQA